MSRYLLFGSAAIIFVLAVAAIAVGSSDGSRASVGIEAVGGPTDPPTPTPSPSPSPSPTATPTPSPTATPTPSPTATSTPTPSATDSPTPTATASPTATATATPSPTASATATPTVLSLVWSDLNCSSDISPVDALVTLRVDAGFSINTNGCPAPGSQVDVLGASIHIWGDSDCGGEITPVDSLKILRKDAGLVYKYEAGCPLIGADVQIVLL